MFAKGDVNGPNTQPMYKYLKETFEKGTSPLAPIESPSRLIGRQADGRKPKLADPKISQIFIEANRSTPKPRSENKSA